MSPAHAAFAVLYKAHQPWLYRWIRGRTGSSELAADLAQDTFLRLLAHQPRQTLQEPRAYLTTIAKGLMANWYRRQSLEQAYLESLAVLPAQHVPSAEHQAIIREALVLIDAMLADLPPQVRRVFLLSQFEGLGYADIGKRLDLSLSTAKRHMKRALVGCLAHAP